MSSTIAMTVNFDPNVTFNGQYGFVPVTNIKTFGSNEDVTRFLTAYEKFMNLGSNATAQDVVNAWWNSVTHDLVANTGVDAPPITLA